MVSPTHEELQYILESAIQAPSADNHHNFHFIVHQTGVDVWHTAEKLPKSEGYRRALALLSLGAVAENIAIAGDRFDLQMKAILFPEPDKPDLIFRVMWDRGSNKRQDLWKVIPERHKSMGSLLWAKVVGGRLCFI